MFKIPEDLLTMPEHHQVIHLDGCKIIESCHHEKLVADSIYVNERVLLCMLSGKIALDFASGTDTVEEGQVGLLNRNVYAPYRKHGTPERGYASVLFFLNDAFIQRFLAERKIVPSHPAKAQDHFVTEPTLQFLDFVRSVLNLFQSKLKYDRQLLQLKVTELLIHLTNQHPEIASQLLSGPIVAQKDLVDVMEQNYLKYASLEEFAAMSGRSLATFKRDFQRTFKVTPAKWLRVKRLEQAHYLLQHTGTNVTKVYNQVGFANYSHFSRVFKDHFGYGPGSMK
ncbi:helix-turn-helix domain-containing protein [Tunicatimonas pelagia]|uniref:helix-turn-helix domain-containing protein n=1 Tax=Tunicatimonas pelagia TaxID=931531 RepID=UPI002666E1B4|nr:AraC family transcriptional regulator [Tunicatimonas pelagia]WKN42614.1 AraC family transcriptional regulator [Tunicatimonas pelagia]